MTVSEREAATRIFAQHDVRLPQDRDDDCIVGIALRLRLLRGRNEASLGCLELARAERDHLRAAIYAALEAAEDEGVDRYRGTDETRAFVILLREALEDENASPADEEGAQGAVGGEGGEQSQGGENQS